eukprot:4003457-Pyramimonas_sp.AAC.1
MLFRSPRHAAMQGADSISFQYYSPLGNDFGTANLIPLQSPWSKDVGPNNKLSNLHASRNNGGGRETKAFQNYSPSREAMRVK